MQDLVYVGLGLLVWRNHFLRKGICILFARVAIGHLRGSSASNMSSPTFAGEVRLRKDVSGQKEMIRIKQIQFCYSE
jgi:hypothetical protein